MKPKEFFPTFPSKAGLERRRKVDTPPAPVRGQEAPRLKEEDLRSAFGDGIVGESGDGQAIEERGAGFALRFEG